MDTTMQAAPSGARLKDVYDFEADLKPRPENGALPLPMLTLDLEVYRSNRDALLRYGAGHHLLIAPHVKTAMLPNLAVDFVEAGGWGITVADVRQATVMVDAGIKRVLIANEVGGIHGARHFALLAAAHPDVEFFVFADSVDTVEALAVAWQEVRPARCAAVLLELGAGRAGARNLDAFARVVDAAIRADKNGDILLAGVAAYEGAAAIGDMNDAVHRVDMLLSLQGRALEYLRQSVGSNRRLIVTAGGSMYLDRVAALLGRTVELDGNADLIIRPGAILFSDHGLYERALTAMGARHGFAQADVSDIGPFRPALRVWAEVLSRPESGLAICGMGMRHASYDAGLPRALRVFRDGVDQQLDTTDIIVTRLNDQHAFLSAHDVDLKVGDVVEFGISHPCTCMHLWRTVRVLDAEGNISGQMSTNFD